MQTLLSFLGIDLNYPQVQAAILSFLGVVITGGVAIFTWWQNRQKDRRDAELFREEKRRDLLRAIWSDIFPVWAGLYLLGEPPYKTASVKRAFEIARENKDDDYTPFVTQIAGTLFEQRLIEEVVFLRTGEIEPIVKFYHQIRTLNKMAAELQGDRYKALPANRKQRILLDLLKLEDQATQEAREALLVIEKELDLPEKKRVANATHDLKPRRRQ